MLGEHGPAVVLRTPRRRRSESGGACGAEGEKDGEVESGFELTLYLVFVESFLVRRTKPRSLRTLVDDGVDSGLVTYFWRRGVNFSRTNLGRSKTQWGRRCSDTTFKLCGLRSCILPITSLLHAALSQNGAAGAASQAGHRVLYSLALLAGSVVKR